MLLFAFCIPFSSHTSLSAQWSSHRGSPGNSKSAPHLPTSLLVSPNDIELHPQRLSSFQTLIIAMYILVSFPCLLWISTISRKMRLLYHSMRTSSLQ